jgi:hypothetical protein
MDVSISLEQKKELVESLLKYLHSKDKKKQAVIRIQNQTKWFFTGK